MPPNATGSEFPMARHITPEVFNGYRDEVLGYLPGVRSALSIFQADPAARSNIEDARRQIHIVKGASSMIGMAPLSQVAWGIEQILEAIGNGTLMLSDQLAALLDTALDMITTCIETCASPAQASFDGFDELKDALLHAGALTPEQLQDMQDEPPACPADDEQKTEPEPTNEPAASSPDTGIKPPRKIPRELLEVFKLEAEDHFNSIRSLLESLQHETGSNENIQDLRRTVHTLKGSAGAVGFEQLAGLAHRMEDLLDALSGGAIAMNDEVVRLLAAAADILEDSAAGKAAQAALDDMYARLTSMLTSAQPAAQTPPQKERRSGVSDRRLSTREPLEAPASDDMVRVSQERIDSLIKTVGELVINRSTLQQHLASLDGHMHAMDAVVERLRNVAGRLETEYELAGLGRFGTTPSNITTAGHGFDELEFDRYTEFHHLLRQLSEAATDIKTCRHELETSMNACTAVSTLQGRLSSDIQAKLMEVRMVPLVSITNRLRQIVRVVSQSQGKLVDLVIEGEHIEIDKKVLDEMMDPLMHVIRNDIDHGIENPEERRVQGKHERGLIRVRAYYEGSKIVIAVSDDGAGLQIDRIREAAVARGLMSADESRSISEDDLYQLIFQPNFSTAEKISEVSGRGIGMDVVKRQVSKLQGTLLFESSPGRGTLLTIRLPMSLSIRRALLVQVNSDRYAVPLSSLKRILRLPAEQIPGPNDAQKIVHGKETYPYVHLGRFMGAPPVKQQSEGSVPLLIVDAGTRFVALHVDTVLNEQEVVVKNLGSLLQRIRGVSGATIMGDGRVMLIINPLDIGTADENMTLKPTAQVQVRTLREDEQLTVMIVDDSISVRQVVSNLIESSGWRALGASDGFAALEVLQRLEKRPDIILLDVEMPRMDGYELLTRLKGRDLWRRIPVVMLTSRAGAKHRLRALELGAAEYIIKPYKDDEMRATIKHLVTQSRSA